MVRNTTRETVKLLCKNLLTRLRNNNAIDYNAEVRLALEDQLVERIGAAILTEEDLRSRALDMIGLSSEHVSDEEIGESEKFKTAKGIIRKDLGDDVLNGFYFQKTLKQIAEDVVLFLMENSQIDEVYEADDELERRIVDIVRRFDPARSN